MPWGARIIEGRGSRVRFELNGVIATFHRPHPQKEAKPYSGKLLLRLTPEIHAAVATAAQVSGKSINQWAAEALVTAVQQ